MSQQASAFVVVFVGGGIGSLLRHAVNQACASFFGIHFPAGTLVVNIIGSLAMGILAGWFAFRGDSPVLRLFLATGVLGGFTTFSAFSLDAVLLWQRGQTVMAALYAGGSVAAGILGICLGIGLTRAFLS